MIQLLIQAADENNENLGQWSLLTTTIVVSPNNLSLNSEAFIPNWRSEDLCQLERLQPRRQAKHNSMRQTALNSSSNSWCCYSCTCQSDQEKKKKMNQTPSNWQSQIQSWTCWFQRSIREAFSPNVRSKSNYWRWRCLCTELKAFNNLLPSYEGRDCYSRKIVDTSEQRRQNANISKPYQRLKEDNRKH